MGALTAWRRLPHMALTARRNLVTERAKNSARTSEIGDSVNVAKTPLVTPIGPSPGRVTRGAWKSAAWYEGGAQGGCRGRRQNAATEARTYRDPGAARHPGLLRPARGTARVGSSLR